MPRACAGGAMSARRGGCTRTDEGEKRRWLTGAVVTLRLMPGSIIYVGLADSVWSETPAALNADSLHALTQRIPQ